jgi:cytochrome c-type protein NapC
LIVFGPLALKPPNKPSSRFPGTEILRPAEKQKLWQKSQLISKKDLYHETVGTMNTRAEFEERRLLMAQRVWDKMKETDSRECRNCHDVAHMAFNKQLSFQHNPVQEMGRTCIDCHMGIAHDLPAGEELTLNLQ